MQEAASDARKAVGWNVAGYGQGKATIGTEELMRLDPEALGRRLCELFESPHYQPPLLPTAAAQILKLSAIPDVDVREILEVLGTDPLLLGRVMATAQSPSYGGSAAVRTLQDAVRRLGLRGLRNIVVEAALHLRVFRTPTYTECMESVRRHSLVTAHFAHLVCRRAAPLPGGPVDPNEAFLAGLVHDVGLAGGLLVLADGRRRESAPSLVRYWASIDGAHPLGGAVMAQAWGLAAEQVETVRAHHARIRSGQSVSALTACVCMADHLAQLLGARVQYDAAPGASDRKNDADVTAPADLFACRDALRLTPAKMEVLFEAARELYPMIG